MVFKNGVKNIQATGYNVAGTVCMYIQMYIKNGKKQSLSAEECTGHYPEQERNF